MDKKIVLVSHGELSKGMLHSISMIIGENQSLMCFGMMPDQHCSFVSDQIEKLAKENPNTQYIVVADLLGGSVCNSCMSLIELPNVKLVSGMNMGLIIELLFAPAPMEDEDIKEKIELCKNGITQITQSFINDESSIDEDFF